MDGNPYARMVEVIRGETADTSGGAVLGSGPVRMREGQVTGVLPLCLSVAGTVQPTGAVRVPAELELQAGDRVLLLTQDDQTFYIVMRW